MELLLIYGADPGVTDGLGNDAAEFAARSGHTALAARLAAAKYELSDRLSYFLCQKMPDHTAGQHFLIPGDPGVQLPRVDELRVAKRKLQGNLDQGREAAAALKAEGLSTYTQYGL